MDNIRILILSMYNMYNICELYQTVINKKYYIIIDKEFARGLSRSITLVHGLRYIYTYILVRALVIKTVYITIMAEKYHISLVWNKQQIILSLAAEFKNI